MLLLAGSENILAIGLQTFTYYVARHALLALFRKFMFVLFLHPQRPHFQGEVLYRRDCFLAVLDRIS